MTAAWQAARQAKHAAYVVGKRLRPRVIAGRDHLYAATARLRPYRFSVERYQDPRGSLPFDFFLHQDPPPGWVVEGLATPRVIRCLWTGDNPLTDNRRRGLDALQRMNPDVPVELITADRVAELVVPEHPLHAAYPLLSAVHRSDYLRGYLLHHHGGGYADIKPTRAAWTGAFDLLEADPGAWVVGYPEVDSDLVANLGGRLGRDVRASWSQLIGNAVFVARPRTPFTAEWLAEAERRLDYYHAALRRHPASDPYGRSPGYPVTWIGLQADVVQPLQLKHLDHVRQDPRLLPQLHDYR